MRYRLALLMLLAMLPAMNLLAAPVPDPSAVLDIGPPPKGWSMEKHCKREIDKLNYHDSLFCMAYEIDAEMRKLPSVVPSKDLWPRLARNLRVKEEDGGRRLRLTFRSGSRAEQVIIINALLRADLQAQERHIKDFEHWIRSHEKDIVHLENRIKWEQKDHDAVASYRKSINDLRSNRIPARRAEIARLKEFKVIKWAK